MQQDVINLISEFGQDITYYVALTGSANSYEDLAITFTDVAMTAYVDTAILTGFGKGQAQERLEEGLLDSGAYTFYLKGDIADVPKLDDKIEFDSKTFYINNIITYYDNSNVAYYVIMAGLSPT